MTRWRKCATPQWLPDITSRKDQPRNFEEKAEKERRGQVMFHWPLEFPEVVVKRRGFDGFIGNPPFMGGKKISGVHGLHFPQKRVGLGLRGVLA